MIGSFRKIDISRRRYVAVAIAFFLIFILFFSYSIFMIMLNGVEFYLIGVMIFSFLFLSSLVVHLYIHNPTD